MAINKIEKPNETNNVNNGNDTDNYEGDDDKTH